MQNIIKDKNTKTISWILVQCSGRARKIILFEKTKVLKNHQHALTLQNGALSRIFDSSNKNPCLRRHVFDEEKEWAVDGKIYRQLPESQNDYSCYS